MNINGNTLEYVGSGMGNTRIVYDDIDKHPHLLDYINGGFERMNTDPIHKMGVLYNAFIEPKYGNMFKRRHRPHLHSIHADSGGLQVMTLGKKITPELKRQIYTQQATNSDMGMCFDEIPVITTGKTSVATTAGRYFDERIVRERALKTGHNILEQERIFEELGTQAEVCAIVQGHDGDSLKVWADSLREVMGHDFHKVSFTDTSMGTGMLEDAKVAFYSAAYRGTGNHIHFLGVGSIRRLLPMIVFMQNGVYENLHISYDSTSHTSGIQKGKYYIGLDSDLIRGGTGAVQFPKERNYVWERIFQDINQIHQFPFDMEYFYQMSTTSPTKNQKSGGCMTGPIFTSWALFVGSVVNFQKDVNRLLESKEALLDFIKIPLHRSIYEALYQVKTVDDFVNWEKQCGRYLPSDPLPKLNHKTLDSFF